MGRPDKSCVFCLTPVQSMDEPRQLYMPYVTFMDKTICVECETQIVAQAERQRYEVKAAREFLRSINAHKEVIG